MSLSCTCDFEPEAGSTCWISPSDFAVYEAKRTTRCASCDDQIKPGDDCAKFTRFKIPAHDVELAIYGEDGEIPRAPHYHCERCAGLFFSLVELDYCVDMRDDMRDLAREYAALRQPARRAA